MNRQLDHHTSLIPVLTNPPVPGPSESLHRSEAPRRHAMRLGFAIFMGATILALPASGVCPTLPTLTTPAEAAEVIGASANLDSTHLSQRVHTEPYNGPNSVPGGEYAAVAVDGILYDALRNEGSDTVNATAVNNFRNDLNNAVRPKRKFVSGHLVNQEFGGNRANGSNFSTITSKTNSAMSNHGEKSAKSIMTSIHSKYHGDNASSAWVAVDSSGTKKFKPGILYETEITTDQSVLDYETSTGDTLIEDTRIKPAKRARLAASLQTRLRFIMHEYQFDVNGNNPTPTGNWFDMPQNVFDQYVGASGDKLGVSLPDSGVTDLGNRTTVTVANHPSGGIEITWDYWNSDPNPN